MTRAKAAATWVPIDSLLPWPGNPRVNDGAVDRVAKSIERFGFGAPLVARKDGGEIIAGHTRLKAAVQLGLDKVPVRFVDLDETDAHLLAVADNKTAEIAEWDDDVLRGFIEAQTDEDIEAMGFDDKALADLMADPKEEGQAVMPDENPTTKPGDLYILGRNRLLCGDSTKADDVARLLDGAEPYLMVTDPPYGVEYDASWRTPRGGALPSGTITNDDKADWGEAWGLSPAKVAYTWCASGGLMIASGGVLERSGYNLRDCIVWVKNQARISRGHYHKGFESCWYAVKKGASAKWIGGRKQNTVWEFGLDERVGGGHSTQKPLEAMLRPIKNHEGDVYEPFAGTGTTIIACEQLHRKCYAMEIMPAYCDVIVKRWEDYTGEKAERVKP